MYNVKSFNATGNGKTDDTQAIQTAIDTASQNPLGGQIFFPEGTYRIDSPICIVHDGIELVGAGRNSTVLQCYSTNNHAVIFQGQGSPPTNLGDCAIRHLGIQQMVNNTEMNASLLYIQYVYQFQAENLRLWGVGDSSSNFAQQLIFAQGTSVYISHIDGVGAKSSGIKCYAQFINNTLYGNDYILANITIQMNGKVGRGLNLIDINGGAVEAVNCNFLAGEQCHISNTAFAAFTNCYFDSAQKPVSIDANSEHVYFSNCEFANRPGGGAIVADATNVVFNGCMVINNGGNGIELSSQSSNVIISNCVIDGNNTEKSSDGSGIYLQSGASKIQIVGNLIGNITPRFKGEQEYGVNLAGNGDNVLINSNNLSGNKSGAVHGTAKVEWGNLI